MLMQAPEPGSELAEIGNFLARTAEANEQRGWESIAGQWVRLPDMMPWGVVHFVGGAALASAPQLCYDKLWADVCERSGVAVIATPYDVAPQHDRLATKVGEGFEAACSEAIARGMLPADVRTFRVGHSLGSKLLVIEACRGGAGTSAPLGLLAFNNFGVEDSVNLATSVVAKLQDSQRAAQMAAFVSTAFTFAKQIGTAMGTQMEFSPSPSELQRLAGEAFYAPSTCFFRFESDELDCSAQLMESIGSLAETREVRLPGQHLSPVAVKQELDASMASLLGVRSLTIGDSSGTKTTADALVKWLVPEVMQALPSQGETDADDNM